MNATTTRTSHRPGPAQLLQSAALLVGSGISAWWLTYTRPEKVAAEQGFPLSEADDVIHSFTLPAWAENTLGVGALVVTVVTAILLIRAWRAGRLGTRWALALLALVPIPMMAGVLWVIATAPIIGANIGLGLGIMAFGPATLILLVVAVVMAILAWRAG
ncbi:hypothetical protein [Nocardiopsis sp. MG754419]|uniref:hypothetical protein n=1 Tax=Nocardiopsis sp. MG754419 TaxID=2259865 RepID=UPI001BA59773|nr:hypothetical protein [Nocardiopsis sp. MG754419]MBR8741815.1 hypothetical protein [Nocardiopsis sp. MG754419]